jgi:hypothetical protein
MSDTSAGARETAGEVEASEERHAVPQGRPKRAAQPETAAYGLTRTAVVAGAAFLAPGPPAPPPRGRSVTADYHFAAIVD